MLNSPRSLISGLRVFSESFSYETGRCGQNICRPPKHKSNLGAQAVALGSGAVGPDCDVRPEPPGSSAHVKEAPGCLAPSASVEQKAGAKQALNWSVS